MNRNSVAIDVLVHKNSQTNNIEWGCLIWMIEYKEDLSTEVVTYDTGISVTSNLTNKK